MAIHFGPRVHAFVHGLFGRRDEAETRVLYLELKALLSDPYDLRDAEGRAALIEVLSRNVASEFEVTQSNPRYAAIANLVERLINYECIWRLPNIDWDEKRSTSEWWELRDELIRQKSYAVDVDQTFEFLSLAIKQILAPIVAQIGPPERKTDRFDLSVRTNLLDSLRGLPEALEEMLETAFAGDLVEAQLFVRLREQFERNLVIASGGHPLDTGSFNKALLMPSKARIDDADKLVTTYLGDTPLIDFLIQDVEFVIPTKTRFEHAHIVAGSGHGKTQTLQYLIAQDLPAVEAGKRSVVVIDSQGDLINTISNLDEFAPGGALHDRIVIIDPTDVEFPVSLNLFDVGIERLKDYNPLERERLTNSILELYDFVLGSLLDAQMTQKQSVIFRYVTRLMLHIPNATIHTLRELMEPDSHIRFADDIAKLSGTAKHFFETEFTDKEFTQTRKQVLRRLWGILENQTFERMFSHPKSKLDLYAEMNAGKVILINTAKDLLKEQGSQIFGRFFIAMIAQAAQERATLPANKRMPTFVYVDEAADYFDRNIGIILSQARKYNVGMVLAHQYLGQLDAKLQEAFGSNTSIKLAGGVSAKDARTLAPMLYCTPELIERQPKGSFAAHVRDVSNGALPLSFPFGYMEGLPEMTPAERLVLRDIMRARHAVHYSELGEAPPEDTSADAGETTNESPTPEEPPRRTGDIDIEPGSEW